MQRIKRRLVALPDLLSLELSLVVIIGLISGMILASGIFLLKNFNTVFIPALAVAFLSFGFNSFNAIFDKYLDSINKPKRPIPKDIYSPTEAFFLSVFFFFTAILIALHFSSSFYLLCAFFVFLAVIYSLPPMYLKGVAFIGTLIAAIMYGILPVLAGFSLFLPVSGMNFAYLTITFLFALSAICLKDFETYLGDRQYSIRTFPVLLGKQLAVKVSIALLLLPYLLIAILSIAGVFNPNALLVALLGFWALMFSRSFYYDSSKENSKMVLSQAILLSMLSGLFLALILAA